MSDIAYIGSLMSCKDGFDSKQFFAEPVIFGCINLINDMNDIKSALWALFNTTYMSDIAWKNRPLSKINRRIHVLVIP